MANVDRPNGFRPAKTQLGASWSGLVRKYGTADRSADTTNDHGDLYIGDPVAINASGDVLVANSGDTILGVVVGTGDGDGFTFGDIEPFNPDGLQQRHLPHEQVSGACWVCPAEGVLFEAQTAADLDLVPGSLADISTDAAEAHGSRTTGNSTAEIVTVVNSDVKVVEDNLAEDNDTTLTNARHLVKFQTTVNSI